MFIFIFYFFNIAQTINIIIFNSAIKYEKKMNWIIFQNMILIQFKFNSIFRYTIFFSRRKPMLFSFHYINSSTSILGQKTSTVDPNSTSKASKSPIQIYNSINHSKNFPTSAWDFTTRTPKPQSFFFVFRTA